MQLRSGILDWGARPYSRQVFSAISPCLPFQLERRLERRLGICTADGNRKVSTSGIRTRKIYLRARTERRGIHIRARTCDVDGRFTSRRNRTEDRVVEEDFAEIHGDRSRVAIVAVNNAINRPASIAPNSAEIEIQVVVAGWMYRPMRNIDDGWQRQSPTLPSSIPILSSPCLSLSLLGQCVHPSNILDRIQMRHVRARRIFARRSDFGEFNSRFTGRKKRIPRVGPHYPEQRSFSRGCNMVIRNNDFIFQSRCVKRIGACFKMYNVTGWRIRKNRYQ